MSERDIFTAAREMTDAVARSAYLDGACGGDTGLRARVEALLRAHEQPDSLLDNPAVGAHDPDAGTTRTIALEGGAGTDDEVPLGFLTPATRPDSLGREHISYCGLANDPQTARQHRTAPEFRWP